MLISCQYHNRQQINWVQAVKANMTLIPPSPRGLVEIYVFERYGKRGLTRAQKVIFFSKTLIKQLFFVQSG